MKRIFAIQTDTLACHLYRTVYPFTHLDPEKWTYAWGHPDRDIMDYDVVVAQRVAGDSPLWRDICYDPNILAVYDMDDWLLGIDPGNTVPYSIYHPIERETEENIRMADAVTVSTPKMAEAVVSINPNVFVLENCLHPDSLKYGIVHNDRFTVGWGGSPFHHQDWGFMPAVLKEFHRLYPDTRFHMMGADYTFGAVPVYTTGFQDMDSYLLSLDFSVGLAPLARNTFNDMKSWCKAMEYAARGIPILAEDWGQYTSWVEGGLGGDLCDREDWLPALIWYRENPRELETASRCAREYAQKWTIDKHISRWEHVYSGGW